jgi:hypothetical protein
MDPPRNLRFEGAGDYWRVSPGKRRNSRYREPSTWEEAEAGETAYPALGDPDQVNSNRSNPEPPSSPESQGGSPAFSSRSRSSSMGPIKDNGTALERAGGDSTLTLDPGSKRKATEEPNTPSDNKRIKSSHSEEPDTDNIPKMANVIPFPEKASPPSKSWTSVLTS